MKGSSETTPLIILDNRLEARVRAALDKSLRLGSPTDDADMDLIADLWAALQEAQKPAPTADDAPPREPTERATLEGDLVDWARHHSAGRVRLREILDRHLRVPAPTADDAGLIAEIDAYLAVCDKDDRGHYFRGDRLLAAARARLSRPL